MQLFPRPGDRSAADGLWRIAPPPDLAPWVEAFAGRRAVQQRSIFPIFPTARAELIFHFGDPFLVGAGCKGMRRLPPAGLLGPRVEIYWQSAGPRIDWFMVQLTPLGCRRLIGRRFAELWNRELPLRQPWAGGLSLHERLRCASDFPARVALAVESLRALDPPAAADPLSELVTLARSGRVRSLRMMGRRLGIGPRRLHQLFAAETGIGPKLFLSLMRFGRQLESRHPRPAIARREPDEPEYADDCHAIREFRRFAGLTPGAYVAQKKSGDRLVYTGEPVPLETGDSK